MSCVSLYPQELLHAICGHVFSSGLPTAISSLDPLIPVETGIPVSLPSSFPAANWSESSVRKTLSSLCLVNRAWSEASKPWLWRRLEVRLPHGWLSLVDQIAGDVDGEEDAEQAAIDVNKTIQQAENAAMAARALFGCEIDENEAMKLHADILATLTGPDGSIPPEVRRLFFVFLGTRN